MKSFKILLIAAVMVSATARYLVFEDDTNYYLLPIEAVQDEDLVPTDLGHEEVPIRLQRTRRQVHGSSVINLDGTREVSLKVPLVRDEKNVLSSIGGVSFEPGEGGFKQAGRTAGLALDNINGHGLTLTHSHMPNADQMAAAARVNLLDRGNHKLDANAFVARTMPADSRYSNFNTYGGGADYMYKDKIGAGVKMAQTPLFDKTDYSGYGTMNFFRGRDSSLDLKAGLSKSISPYMPARGWEPNVGLTYSKWF